MTNGAAARLAADCALQAPFDPEEISGEAVVMAYALSSGKGALSIQRSTGQPYRP
jgi:hypothetical protein